MPSSPPWPSPRSPRRHRPGRTTRTSRARSGFAPTGPRSRSGGAAEGPYLTGEFPLRFTALLNAADANPARTDNPDRRAVEARVAAKRAAHSPDPAAVAGLAADLLRVGKADDALNLLGPRSRDRVPDFRVLATLAHVHATRGEWDDAARWHQAAFLDAEFPDDLAGATPDQRAWLKKLEQTHYRRWLAVHRDRAAAKLPPADEPVFPLFPGTPPADAVAVVQQLLLWSPWDTALYWRLAELYAADGKLREAAVIFDQCATAGSTRTGTSSWPAGRPSARPRRNSPRRSRPTTCPSPRARPRRRRSRRTRTTPCRRGRR